MWDWDGRLDRREFHNWLRSLDHDDIVGVASSADGCPLACFLKETKNLPHVEVSDVEIFAPQTRIVTPSWAREFIEEVDEFEDAEYTADEALAILENIAETQPLPRLGDKVRLTGIPDELYETPVDPECPTLLVFERALGGVFEIKGFNGELVELHVGKVMGGEDFQDVIFVEPEFYEAVEDLPDAYPMGAGEID